MEKKTAEKKKKAKKAGKAEFKERVESFPQYKVLLIVLDIIFDQSKFFFWHCWLAFKYEGSAILNCGM